MKKKTIYLFLVLGILILAAVLLFYLWDSSGRRGAELSPQGLSSTPAKQEAAGEVGEVLVSNPETGEEEPLKTALMPRLFLMPRESSLSFMTMVLQWKRLVLVLLTASPEK